MFPKCHSHDSLTSELFPFLFTFSPSLHSALLQFRFSVFLFSIHTKPSEGWSTPHPPTHPPAPGLLPLAEVGFQFLTVVLELCALECVGRPRGPERSWHALLAESFIFSF